MQSATASLNSSQRIAHAKVIVIVGVEIETCLGIVCHHLTDIVQSTHRIEHTKSVGKQETHYAQSLQPIHQPIDILRRFLYAVAPVLQIDVDLHTFLMRIGNDRLDV